MFLCKQQFLTCWSTCKNKMAQVLFLFLMTSVLSDISPTRLRCCTSVALSSLVIPTESSKAHTTHTPRHCSRQYPISTAPYASAFRLRALFQARQTRHLAVFYTRVARVWLAAVSSTYAQAPNLRSPKLNPVTSCVATYRSINCAQFRPNSHLGLPPQGLD